MELQQNQLADGRHLPDGFTLLFANLRAQRRLRQAKCAGNEKRSEDIEKPALVQGTSSEIPHKTVAKKNCVTPQQNHACASG